jgi:hypothetical protein
MPLMSRPRSGSTASLPGGRNFLPPEMRGVEHGCAPHRVKRTTPNGVLGQAGCTVSQRPKTTEVGSGAYGGFAARLDGFARIPQRPNVPPMSRTLARLLGRTLGLLPNNRMRNQSQMRRKSTGLPMTAWCCMSSRPRQFILTVLVLSSSGKRGVTGPTMTRSSSSPKITSRNFSTD